MTLDQNNPTNHDSKRTAPDRRRRESIRITNAVPLLFVILVVCLVAGASIPPVRDQVEKSFTRQPERFITLLFTDEAQSRACKITDNNTQSIDVTLYSELAEARDFSWTVTATPENGEASGRATGTIGTTPGESSAIRTDVAVPKTGPYRINVDLQDRAERLILQCRTAPEDA